MVEKKVGNMMTCQNCNTDLICRLKEYKGNFADTPQWQNEDGTAHYATKNGIDFTCNIPDEKSEDGQQTIETPKEATTETGIAPSSDEYLKERQKEVIENAKDLDEKLQKLIVNVYNNDEITAIYKDVDRLIALEQMIKLKFEEKGIELNVQKIGMYMKLVRAQK